MGLTGPGERDERRIFRDPIALHMVIWDRSGKEAGSIGDEENGGAESIDIICEFSVKDLVARG